MIVRRARKEGALEDSRGRREGKLPQMTIYSVTQFALNRKTSRNTATTPA